MSDGGRESAEENDRRRVILRGGGREGGGGEDDYGRAIARIAVAQICESLGFESLQSSALENLADAALRYMGDLGRTVHFYSNLAGRSECNVFDIVRGLEDLGPEQDRGSDCVGSSSTVTELIDYVNYTDGVQFAQPVPSFPVVRPHRLIPSFLQIGETPEVKHIPTWLPAFPDPHTYVHTPVWNERATDLRAEKIEQARQRRKAERSLLSLQQRLACDGFAEHSSAAEPRDAGKAKQAVESIQSLVPPLLSGEKEASSVLVPSSPANKVVVDNHISVLETFAPAIEAAKSRLDESGDCEKDILRNKRPLLPFKFGSCKKFLGVPLDLMLQSNGPGQRTPWFGRDDEKDDKKRRVEQILKESMENPQELAQL